MGGILDLLKKSSRSKNPLNMIVPILDLPKILSEVIVPSKCGPLARIEKQAMS